MTPQFAIPALGSLGGLFAVTFAAAIILLHILFAVCIASDMTRLRERGRPIIILTPFLWAFAALMLGLVAVAFYWLCHYSRFTRKDI
jgi:amino acid transporter